MGLPNPGKHLHQPYNPTVHSIALIAALMTFPLIFMGGLVTSHGAALSVPDWPNTWGYNMFLFPPNKWVGGILYEHTHRLAASTVGFVTIVLMVAAWLSDRRPWVRWTSVGIFLAACLQGIIGGLRVVLSNRNLSANLHGPFGSFLVNLSNRITDHDMAIIHGCMAQVFFCFVATFCVMTSRFWSLRTPLPNREIPAMRRVLLLAIITVCILLGQLIVGAIMRHSDAGLAIPDFPTSYGHWLPPLKIDAQFRQEAIHRFGLNLGLNRVTLFQIWIHFAHRIGALLVTLSVLALSSQILHRLRRKPAFFRPTVALLFLLVTQLTLGILTVLLRKPADIASAHVAVGALVLVTAWVITVRAFGVIKTPRLSDISRRTLPPALLYTTTDK